MGVVVLFCFCLRGRCVTGTSVIIRYNFGENPFETKKRETLQLLKGISSS